MRVFASISPWLPLLKDHLASFVVFEEKAAELYHLSLLEKPTLSHRTKEAILGIWKDGKSAQTLHEQLIRNGCRRRPLGGTENFEALHGYFREDLGAIRFVCPQTRPQQKPSSRGLFAAPDKKTGFLLENPHSVDVPYLGQNYEVLIPQVGRFILDKGLNLKTGKVLNPGKVYQSSQDLLIMLDLLISHQELQDEALDDFLEIRPPVLLREFFNNLKQNGPGSVLWDSAQSLYLERYPGSKIVSLTKWYWGFLRDLGRLLEKLKNPKD